MFDSVFFGLVFNCLGERFRGDVNGWCIVVMLFLLLFLNIGKFMIYNGVYVDLLVIFNFLFVFRCSVFSVLVIILVELVLNRMILLVCV